MKQKWKSLSNAHKVITILSVVVSVLVAVFGVLILENVWEEAVNFCIPLFGIENLCQAYLQWDTNRTSAGIALALAILFLVCSCILFL